MKLMDRYRKRNNTTDAIKIQARFKHHKSSIKWDLRGKSKLYYNCLEYTFYKRDDLDDDVVDHILEWLHKEGFRTETKEKTYSSQVCDIKIEWR